MKRFALLLLLVGLVFTAAACKTSPNEGVRTGPEVGALAPDFTLLDTAGDKITLSDYRGQVVLLNFWATWCPPCRQEMPGIQDRYEIHRPDLVVLAVDNDESSVLVKDFAEDYQLTFNPLLDPNAEVQIMYQIRGYPTSMFVDENGFIQIVHIGLMTEAQLDDYLAEMGLAQSTASN